MGTHNIGFYEDLTKIIFQLSSNFIKYAPYLFFCWFTFVLLQLKELEKKLLRYSIPFLAPNENF